ncbi:unnamed protein product, partial [Effrenium voratum]
STIKYSRLPSSLVPWRGPFCSLRSSAGACQPQPSMGTFGRLHVPILFPSHAGFAGAAAHPLPSLEATLTPFLPEGRSMSFPVKPERDAEGLVVVTTDDAMRKSFDETLRRGLVRCRYRLLADVASPGEIIGTAELVESGQLRAEGTDAETFPFELYSGPLACPSANIRTALYLVSARPSTKAARQVRRSFASAGAPVMFDPVYHPLYREASRSAKSLEDMTSAIPGSLTMQLFELEMPDPFRPWEMVHIAAPMPQEWLAIHPLAELEGDEDHACSADWLETSK